jgi:SM-20-related protein
MTFFLNPDVDREHAAASIREIGRAQLKDVLEPATAGEIVSRMQAAGQWSLVTHLEGKHRQFDAAGIDALPRERLQPLHSAINATAQRGFAYLYENIPLYDLWHAADAPDHPLLPVYDLLSTETFLDVCRQVTGADDIGFLDAQATRYRAGHFLTTHDDDAAGKNRRAAYVLNLTPEWSQDWGGQLLFFDADGNVSGGFTPAFNVLNIFMVPAAHSVSMVTPFAGAARYSITGWLRAGADPGPG